MSYKMIYVMAHDQDLQNRISGCIATQSGYAVPSGIYPSPPAVANHIAWQCAGQPGWGDAYSYAVGTNVVKPGDDEGVITDAMILSAVQAVLGITPEE